MDPYRFVAGAALLTLALCIAAAVLPSLRAGRLAVVAALRTD